MASAGVPRPGPYHTTSGPDDGPIRRRHGLPALAVYSRCGGPWPIGIARRVGEPGGHDEASATYRVEVDGVELPGAYVVVGRRFLASEPPPG